MGPGRDASKRRHSKSRKAAETKRRNRPSGTTGSGQARREAAWSAWTPPAIVAAMVFAGSIGLTAVAGISDLAAFTAVATPAVYAWLVLCLVCALGMAMLGHSQHMGRDVPRHLRIALFLGVVGGLLAVPSAVRVLQKSSAPRVQAESGAPPDWRDRTLEGRSFAGRSLRGANAEGAVLRHVDLSRADLSEADLHRARLTDVQLGGANLCGADLRGADLRTVNDLPDVRDWSYTFYDAATRFPRGFDIESYTGPVLDTGRGLLYSCRTGSTRRIAS